MDLERGRLRKIGGPVVATKGGKRPSRGLRAISILKGMGERAPLHPLLWVLLVPLGLAFAWVLVCCVGVWLYCIPLQKRSAARAAIQRPELECLSIDHLTVDRDLEFVANIHPWQETRLPSLNKPSDPTKGSPWEPFADWEWTELDQQLLEDFERHERILEADPRA